MPVLLDIVGDGADRERLEALVVRVQASGHVTFHAEVSPAELHRRYAACDLFVLPSVYDTLPSIVIAPLATALPSVGLSE